MISNDYTGYVLRKVKHDTYSLISMKDGKIKDEIAILADYDEDEAFNIAGMILEKLEAKYKEIEFDDYTKNQ